MIGVSGPSGGGKTTFADLLVGLLAPQSGAISVGSRRMDPGTLAGWRKHLSYVSQDPFLFHDTVRRNLSWGSPSASDDEMWQALALAGAEQLVRRMEHGLETVVGDRGMLVSGGERQRIALAAALLRRPRLLVLDEATSAIDLAGEAQIMERLLRMVPCPTIVMIAHRPESLARCARTFLFRAGRLQRA
jgi:ATP-binding cassette subfamily C protein